MSVLRARLRAASASAIGAGDASIMGRRHGVRGGDSYFRNSDWLFPTASPAATRGTLGAGFSSQPPKLPDGLQGIVLGIGLAMASRVPKLRVAPHLLRALGPHERDVGHDELVLPGRRARRGAREQRVVHAKNFAVVRGAGAAESSPGLVCGALLARCWREEKPSPLGEICGSSGANNENRVPGSVADVVRGRLGERGQLCLVLGRPRSGFCLILLSFGSERF